MPGILQRDRDLFENLFVLELANTHWGRVEHGFVSQNGLFATAEGSDESADG